MTDGKSEDVKLDHLDEYAKGILAASEDIKIRSINRDVFVSHPFIEGVINAVEWRLALPFGPRRPSMALAGASGLGKTQLVREIMRRQGMDIETGLNNKGERPIVCVDCSAISKSDDFRVRFYESLGIPANRRDDLLHAALIIKKSPTKLIFFDEAHTIRKVALAKERSLIIDAIKLICNASERSILLAGDVDVADVVSQDTHMKSRFSTWNFHPWKKPSELRDLINPILSTFPFERPSPINDDVTLAAVIDICSGITEKIVLSLKVTAMRCVKDGKRCITRKDWIRTLSEPF